MIRGLAGALALSMLMACGGDAGRDPKAADRRQSRAEPEPESAEWLYATDSFRGNRKAECEHVLTWIEREEKCANSLCRHGARLGFDWQKVCGKVVPGRLDDVRTMTSDYEKRSVVGSTACGDQANSLIESGCKNEESCADDTQRWATECGAEVGTPLVVKMIELSVQRSGGKFTMDTRGCGDLAASVRAAAKCEPGFACEDAIPAVEVHRARCLAGVTLLPAPVLVFEAAVKVGAGTEVAAAALDAGAAKLALGDGWVQTGDDHAVVLVACGKRVSTVEELTSAKGACEGQDLVFARVFEKKDGKELRVGRARFDGPLAFASAYPALLTEAERAARNAESAAALARALDEAAEGFDAARASDATGAVVRALIAAQEHFDDSELQVVLAERDAKLVPVFTALGAAKARVMKPTMKKATLVPFALRTERLPLADVTPDGAVSVDATTPASRFDLSSWLPTSTRAYLEAASKALDRASKRTLEPKSFELYALAVGEQASLCGAQAMQVDVSRLTLLDCAFGRKECTDETVEAEKARLAEARRAHAAAYLAATVALASLDPGTRAEADAVVRESGCVPPKL